MGMSQQDNNAIVEKGLQNLKATSMDDVRGDRDEDESLSTVELVEQEIDAVYEAYDFVGDIVSRLNITVSVEDFKRLHGQARGREIRIAESIVGSDEYEWRDTVRHELAHVLVREKYGHAPDSHGAEWKEMASRVGAEPTRCASKSHTDGDYILHCLGCDSDIDRHKRSRTIQRPFDYRCGRCGGQLVSHDAGTEPPEEPGVCAVESIPWETKDEWRQHGGEL